MPKAIKIFLVSFVFVLVFYSFLKALFLYFERRNFYLSLKEKRDSLRKRYIELQTSLKLVESPIFLEKKLRNDLNLTREGETIVLLPQKPEEPKEKKEREIEVWQQWVFLVFRRE